MKKYILIYINGEPSENQILFRINDKYKLIYHKDFNWNSKPKIIKHILLNEEECNNCYSLVYSKNNAFKIELGPGRVTFKLINGKIEEIKLLREII